MSKPRVFISSTFYDLKHIRAELDAFLESLGYESVRNEVGDIPYGRNISLEEYCYKEIKSVDIVVSIIGNKFGTESEHEGYSISQVELQTALKENKQVYIFIEKNVLSEYETYRLNAENKDIQYRYVDNIKIYSFIDEIKKLKINNNIKDFETVSDITSYLKEQFAGLFQRFLDRQTHEKEIKLIDRLEATSKNLDNLVNFLTNESKTNKKEIIQILMLNHSLILWLKEKLNIAYNFYILDFNDLQSILKTKGFVYIKKGEKYYEFHRTVIRIGNQQNRERLKISIAIDLFDEQKKLKFVEKNDFKEDVSVKYEIEEIKPKLDIDIDPDDIPF